MSRSRTALDRSDAFVDVAYMALQKVHYEREKLPPDLVKQLDQTLKEIRSLSCIIVGLKNDG